MADNSWRRLLVPAKPEDFSQRQDDLRLRSIIQYNVDAALLPGRPVIIGFPQDEGVRRNNGRVGAAEAPARVRHWLARLSPWDGQFSSDLTELSPADLGDIVVSSDLEASQQALGEVVAAVLTAGAVPIVLGGGHETAYGHYLGYVQAHIPAAIINLDAHLDVRPTLDGRGHSGSPFRQALEHPTDPLREYVCLGLQPHSVSRDHWEYAKQRGCHIEWAGDWAGRVQDSVRHHIQQLRTSGLAILLTLDADVVDVATVPGVSAPNIAGLVGENVLWAVQSAGERRGVTSFEIVELNPRFDVDDRSARWGALAVWKFLSGLAQRSAPDEEQEDSPEDA